MRRDSGETCLDIEHLRAQGDLFGSVPSDSTLGRAFHELTPPVLEEVSRALAPVRAQIWRRSSATTGTAPVILDLDASIVDIHSEGKEGTAATYKGNFYRAFCRVLQVIRLAGRGQTDLAIEVVMLRHEVAVLRRQVHRPALEPADRAVLAGLAQLLPRRHLGRFFVQPATLLRWHRDLLAKIACNFFHVDTVLFRRLYVLVFIHHDTRLVRIAGITSNPAAFWVTQQARNISMELSDQAHAIKFLIRDRDTKFTASFDAVFAADGIRTIKSPVRAPRANALCERVIGTIRRECLDRMLILGRRHLEAVLAGYVEHYNSHRPHRSLSQRPPAACEATPPVIDDIDLARLRRADLLGGLIHEYRMVA